MQRYKNSLDFSSNQGIINKWRVLYQREVGDFITADKERLYWKTKKWYRINKEKDCYELTENAPERARESFKLYNSKE